MYTSYALLLHLMSSSQLPASDDIPRLWPQPASYTNGTTALTLDASAFSIAVSPDAHSSAASANDALAWNVAFYSKEIFSRPADPECANTLDDPTALPLHRLTITLDKREGVGAPFTLGADESYTLALGSPNATLHAATQWGAIRGLETFSQLLQMNRGFAIRNGNGVRIVDSPRFPWRGLMLDPARHFLRVEEITATIDAMAQCKLNALHLHLTDGESFTVRTTEWLGTPFANLSRFGAFAPRLTYSKADLTAIVEHARLRGVRVIPEFDLPAHMASWSLGHPSLITSCPSVNPHPEWPTYYSPADVTSPSLYSAIDAVLTNLAPVFTDNFWHVGGDEPHFACWEANEEVMAWAKVHGNLSSVDLYAIFESRYAAAVRAHGKMVIGWEEIQTLTAPLAEKHPEWIPLRNSTVVHVWEGNAALAAIVAAGYPAIVSSKWYVSVALSLSLSLSPTHSRSPVLSPVLSPSLSRSLSPSLPPRFSQVSEQRWRLEHVLLR